MNPNLVAAGLSSFLNRRYDFVFILVATYSAWIAQDQFDKNQIEQSITFVSYPQETDDKAKSKPERDIDQLQGTWRLVLREYQGELLDTQGLRLTIEGNEFKTVDGSGNLIEAGTMRLYEDESPKADDTTIDAGFESDGKVYHSIYRIKGNTYQTCVNVDPNGERPTKFFSDEGTTNQLMVWSRIEKHDSK